MTGAPGVAAADFETHRKFLASLAYRILGSVAEAQDVVQDAFLRWRQVDRAEIVETRAYLARVVSRLCLNRMKSAHRREHYVGMWLPEPVVAEPAERLADDLSVALLARERLSPLERAAFLLHDVCDHVPAAACEGLRGDSRRAATPGPTRAYPASPARWKAARAATNASSPVVEVRTPGT